MKALQITAVIVSIAIFAAAVLFSHFSTNAAQTDTTSEPEILAPVKPEITIKLSEGAKPFKNATEKTDNKPANDLSLLQKYQNAGTMGQALSKEEFDRIQKDGNIKPPQDDKINESPFGPRP